MNSHYYSEQFLQLWINHFKPHNIQFYLVFPHNFNFGKIISFFPVWISYIHKDVHTWNFLLVVIACEAFAKTWLDPNMHLFASSPKMMWNLCHLSKTFPHIAGLCRADGAATCWQSAAGTGELWRRAVRRARPSGGINIQGAQPFTNGGRAQSLFFKLLWLKSGFIFTLAS